MILSKKSLEIVANGNESSDFVSDAYGSLAIVGNGNESRNLIVDADWRLLII